MIKYDDDSLIPMSDFLREARAAHWVGDTSYFRLHRLVLDGLVAAERVSPCRWAIRRSKMPEVASAIGMKLCADAAPRAAAAEHTTA